MSNLTLDEIETHLNMVASDRSEWTVDTNDAVWIRRLQALGLQGRETGRTGCVYFTVPANMVSIRKPRHVSDEQRAALAERLKKMREARP